VRKDEHARGTDEPKERAEWRRPPKEGQTDDKKSRIKGLLRYDVITDLHWLRGLCDMAKKGQKRLEGGGRGKERLLTPSVDCRKAADEKAERDEQQRARDSKSHHSKKTTRGMKRVSSC
jgi:hypothetical protein